MVNYEDALKKPFTDLTKLVLGIILSIVPIVNWIAQGFILECSGAGKNKPSKKMPEWKNLGDYFVKGFLSYVIMFIYAIPAFIVFLVAVGFAAGSMIAAFSGAMPQEMTNSMMIGQANRAELGQFFSQNWMLAMPALISIAPLLILGLILLAIALYLSPIAVLNYIKNKKFGKAFDFGFVFKRAFRLNYFIVWIIAGVIGLILKMVLSYIPWLGAAIAFFVTGVIAYSMYGEIFREK